MGFLKYKIFFVLILLIVSGCGKSLIKYASKPDEDPYRMFGRIPSREFYVPLEISDSLNLKWESEAYGSFPNSSVSVYDELVFINDLAGRIFCFRFLDGKETGKLKYPGGSVFSTPVVSKSKLIFPVALEKDNLTNLIIYDYQAGKETESIEIPGRVITQMIAEDEDILFTTETGTAYRYNSAGRKIWETKTLKSSRCSPAMSHNLFIFGNDDGEVIALNSITGDSVYIRKIGGQFFSGITISDNVIYVGNENGNLYALNLKDGRLLWLFNTGSRILMNPAADEENIFVGNLGGTLFSINKNNGGLNWEKDFNGILNAAPLVTRNYLIVPDVLFALHLVDKTNGETIKSIPLEGRAKLSPVIHKNVLFIGYDDGVIRAYEFVD